MSRGDPRWDTHVGLRPKEACRWRVRVAALEIARVEAVRHGATAVVLSASLRRFMERASEAERILAQWGSQGAAAALAALRGAR